MESGNKRETRCSTHAVQCEPTRRCPGESTLSLPLTYHNTDVRVQRRKIESDALKMRDFLAEGDVSGLIAPNVQPE
jgi:hypothetical protein